MSSIIRRPDLEDDQRFALMKFRRNVADLMRPDDDDFFLLKWLRARKWDVEAAEKMLRNHFKFRIMWNADKLYTCEMPQVLLNYIPHGISGFDKEGSPIIIIPIVGVDMWGTLHCVTRFDFMKFAISFLEHYLKIANEQGKKYGPEARQLVVLFDLDGFTLKQYLWRPATELIISLIKNYALNYPEILKVCYIINTPKVFAIIFNLIKRFLDEYTLSKIQIYKQGSNKWLPKLLEHVHPSQLPKYYGGTLTDEDGDPKCKSKICWGGKIPKNLYKTQGDDDNNNQDFVEATINKGSKIKLEFDSTDEGSVLKWEFRTYDYDIRFGISSIDNKTGEKMDEVPLGRVSSHEMSEIGFISCRANTKYTVVFDNSSSYLKNKKIRYSVLLTAPIDEMEKGADEIFEENTSL